MLSEFQGVFLVLITLFSGVRVHKRGKQAEERARKLQEEVVREQERVQGLVNAVNRWRQFSERALLQISVHL